MESLILDSRFFLQIQKILESRKVQYAHKYSKVLFTPLLQVCVAKLLAELDATAPAEECRQSEEIMTELFALDEEDLDEMKFPLSYKELEKAQTNCRRLQADATKYKDKYARTEFHGGGKTTTLLTYKNTMKIVVPEALRARVIHWYYHRLGHPGMNRTEETIKQHLWWPEMRGQIHKAV